MHFVLYQVFKLVAFFSGTKHIRVPIMLLYSIHLNLTLLLPIFAKPRFPSCDIRPLSPIILNIFTHIHTFRQNRLIKQKQQFYT